MKRGQASSTAKVIALATLALAEDARRGDAGAPAVPEASEALCRRLLGSRAADRWLARSAVNPLTRRAWGWLEAATLPGIVAHYAHRKRWIEQQVRRALAEGASRLLVLGAGFDTLALRLGAEHAGLTVLEVDHPDTQAAKQQALGDAAPPTLRFLPCDLGAQDLPAALFQAADDTVVVAEGLLMYLADERVRALFQALAAAPASRLRVVFSFMSRRPDGSSGFRPRSAAIERWLAWRGEPFMWALTPQDMAPWLHARGFALRELATTGHFTPGWRAGALEGENLVLCERGPAR